MRASFYANQSSWSQHWILCVYACACTCSCPSAGDARTVKIAEPGSRGREFEHKLLKLYVWSVELRKAFMFRDSFIFFLLRATQHIFYSVVLKSRGCVYDMYLLPSGCCNINWVKRGVWYHAVVSWAPAFILFYLLMRNCILTEANSGLALKSEAYQRWPATKHLRRELHRPHNETVKEKNNNNKIPGRKEDDWRRLRRLRKLRENNRKTVQKENVTTLDTESRA